jgi:hypothetical protein
MIKMRYDLLLIVLALFLALAMLLTLYFGKHSSRHGYGPLPPQHKEVEVVLINEI